MVYLCSSLLQPTRDDYAVRAVVLYRDYIEGLMLHECLLNMTFIKLAFGKFNEFNK